MPSLRSRPTLAAPDDDPWLWLEAIDGPRAVAWADSETARTLARFGGPGLHDDADVLSALFDRPDRIPLVVRRGGRLFNFWRDEAHPRGLWRCTSLESYRAGQSEWDVLLDLDALAEAEGEDWVWAGATVAPGHARALLALSPGGGDATVLREFDLAGRCFVSGGFVLPCAKGEAEWLDGDTLLLASSWGEGMATDAGYARTIRLWRRGEDPAAARVLAEAAPGSMAMAGEVDRLHPDRPAVFVEQRDFFRSRVWRGTAAGPAERIDLPEDAEAQWSRAWLAVRLRRDWTVATAPGRWTTWPAGALLGIGFAAFLAGDRAFRLLEQAGGRRSIESFEFVGERLLVQVLDDLRPAPVLLDPAADWARIPLAGIPATGTASLWPLDSPDESDGTLEALVEDPLTPPSLLLYEPRAVTPVRLRREPPAFDATGLIVTRHDALSEDGTRIPYFQIGPEAGPRGDAPVHLTGYGGFEISELPTYRTAVGRLWLQRGGTSVIACLRGGGEFGPAWHEAGRRAGKAASHADLAAVARDLVARGVTRPGRIAAEGGSNGGLLIANMLTRYPACFGALFCTIPLVDMRRYTRLLAGGSWVAEYGDPDDPADWAFLREISAYHAPVPPAGPPILLATARRDDRVHPGHARKWAAKLRAEGYPAWYYELASGGHGYGKDNRQRATFTALGFRFLRAGIGWGESQASTSFS